MPEDRITRGNWQDAYEAEFSLETLRLIIDMIRELYEASGRWPNATELRAALRKPGS